MSEVSEDASLERPDVERVFDIIRRRHMQFLLPLFLGWLIVWGISWVLPARYKSITTILVEQPTMPQNYVLPNVNDDMQARLQSLKTQIMSQTRLLYIIDNLHLYNGSKDPATMDEKVDQMRKDIDVELVRDPARQDISAFTVAYSASDPHLAQLVTGELTDLFINQNNKVREAESEGTTSFLSQQLEEARQQLAAQEAQVDQFQSEHQGALPAQEASNLQILAGLQTQLQNEQDSLNAARQQRAYLQAMFEQEKAASTSMHVSATGQPGGADSVDLATLDARLETLRAQLADLSSRYTDEYPDVQSLKTQIAKTEAMRENLIAAAKAKSHQDVDDSQLSGPALQLKGQLQSNQIEINNREAAINELKARIGEYQGRLNAEPATDQQLEELTRGYDQSKANYDDLLKKEDESKMATSMEHLQQGERFTRLDPPSLPARPDFPNRLKFCGIGLAVGLALGLIVAGGMELMDDRMYSAKELKGMLPIAVISEIPEVVTVEDRQSSKRKLTWGWAVMGFVTVAIVAGSVFSYLTT